MIIQQPKKVKTGKKKMKSTEGVKSKLYNPVQTPLKDVQLPSSMCPYFESLPWKDRPQFSQLWDMDNPPMLVESKFGLVPMGSILSYQQQNNVVDTGDIIVDALATEPPPFSLPDLSNFFTDVFPLSADLDVKYRSLHVGDEDGKEFERQTRTQSDVGVWHKLRKNRITASNFKRVTTRRANFETLATQLHSTRHVQTSAMAYGIEHEPIAAELYAKTFGRNVYRVGFVINPSCFFLGCSPDRRVYDPDEATDPWGLLEIKCTKSPTISQCDYLKRSGQGNKLMLKRTHAYYMQVMGQMGLTGSNWCDFFVCATDDFHVERITFDKQFFLDNFTKLVKFFFEFFLVKNE